jgi:outer membrane lipoprotein-sorting protein
LVHFNEPALYGNNSTTYVAIAALKSHLEVKKMTRKMIVSCMVLALSCSIVPSVSFGQSESAELIQRIETARQQMTAVLHEGLIITERRFEGMVKRTEAAFTVAFRRPNFLRYHIKGELPVLMVSDGEHLWNFQENDRTYKKRPAPTQLVTYDHWVGQPIALGVGPSLMLMPAPLLKPEQVVLIGQEPLKMDSGETISCYVLEGGLSPEISTMYDSARTRVWVAATDLITRKIESTFIPKSPSREYELKITMVTKSLRFNEDVPESYFTFTPPPDGVERR